MIGAFLVNRIPTGFVAEIATGRVAADEGEDERQDKEPRCAVWSKWPERKGFRGH
ncbi:hypothetical protein [Mesorhizobium muleiense]|jgi:hypothetical protein|uniref:hypothetical protein n=1 Tax=Mesorhizobium muleiense TaxID=1004279 RepID=UPI001F249C1B|nr:hypothetical protein [Mesorhizobium muleiense]MCF6108968.1 hypothetical protein [Mesorhizobium muleiense]